MGMSANHTPILQGTSHFPVVCVARAHNADGPLIRPIASSPALNHQSRIPWGGGSGPTHLELCSQHGFSEAGYTLWCSKSGGMSIADAKRLKELLVVTMRENKVTREVLRKKVVKAPARRELVRHLAVHGLGKRPSASSA